jgi:hypothetical protein
MRSRRGVLLRNRALCGVLRTGNHFRKMTVEAHISVEIAIKFSTRLFILDNIYHFIKMTKILFLQR